MKILVVANSPILAYNVATCLHYANHQVDVIIPKGWSAFTFSRFWHNYTKVDKFWFDHNSNTTYLVDYINAYCQSYQIKCVVPADVYSNVIIMKNFQKIKFVSVFPLSSYETFENLNNKWFFSQIAKNLGDIHPQTWLLENPTQVEEIVCNYPVIVKPLIGTGGKEVYEVQSRQQLNKYAQNCAAKNTLPRLVQEYITGYDLDLTILADHGKVVAWTIQERKFEESGVNFIIDDRILQLGKKVVENVNYHGIVDFDIRYDTNNQKPVIVEANPRFPGSLLYKLWSGVNFPNFGVEVASGKVELNFKPIVGLCIDYGISPKRLLKALLQGKLIPSSLTGHTRNAWKITLSDPIPALLKWLLYKFKPKSSTIWYFSNPLPESEAN